MSRKQKISQADLGQNHLDRALDTFEEALKLLDRHQPSGPPPENLPAPPLPSLLDRCQAIAESQKRPPKLLVCFPGTPQLDPEWWHGRVRFTTFRRLPEVTNQLDQIGRKALIDTMQSDLERRGRDLVLLVTPDEVSFEGDEPENLYVLTCHPWVSFVSNPYTTKTLEEFSLTLREFLIAYPKSPRFQFETLGQSDVVQATKLANALGLQPVEVEVAPDPSKQKEERSSRYEPIGAGPIYKKLCANLGYGQESYSYPSTSRSNIYQSSVALSLSNEGPISRISRFFPRLSILNENKEPARIAALIAQLDTCFDGNDFTERFERIISTSSDENNALFMLLACAHFSGSKEGRLQSLNMLGGALELISENEHDLQILAASLYLDLNEPTLALNAMTQALRRPGMLSTVGENTLHDIFATHQKQGTNEHGHALLIDWLNTNPPRQIDRKRLMIEIGTTRENVPGQGSTRKLGLLCAQLGIDFVTVDMDPHNSQSARRMFRRLGLPFQAITAKGEDYLAGHEGPIDYVFLDAYDFDHGQHSEVRQVRYERHLGSRINEDACHKMHLDCVESLLTCLSDDGVICFDDTWIDESGIWTAKGTTAVPFLLNNGFRLIEGRNHAALFTMKD